eukprot:1551143-Amphidinium_carterae.2
MAILLRLPCHHTKQRALTTWDGSCFYHALTRTFGGPQELAHDHLKLAIMAFAEENAMQLGQVLRLTADEVVQRVCT